MKGALYKYYKFITLDFWATQRCSLFIDDRGVCIPQMNPQIDKMACIVHHGSFSTIGKTFDTLFEWMRQHNYVADGPIREIYHKGDWVNDNPNEYITELQIPIK